MNRFLEWPLNPLAGYASHGKAQVFVAKPPVRKMKKTNLQMLVLQFAFCEFTGRQTSIHRLL